VAPAPVTTPTSNGENDQQQQQVQAFEKVPSPVSEEPISDVPAEEP